MNQQKGGENEKKVAAGERQRGKAPLTDEELMKLAGGLRATPKLQEAVCKGKVFP